MTPIQAQLQPGSSIAEPLEDAVWRKSRYSGTQGNCVQVATNLPGIVAVRDSKDQDGPRLTLAQNQWRTFVSGIKAGEFDL